VMCLRREIFQLYLKKEDGRNDKTNRPDLESSIVDRE